MVLLCLLSQFCASCVKNALLVFLNHFTLAAFTGVSDRRSTVYGLNLSVKF